MLEKILKNDRLIIIAGIAVVSVIAWTYMVKVSVSVGQLISAPTPHAWNLNVLASHFCMWIIMMIAMMLPTAGPMILTFSSISRGRKHKNQPYVKTSIFTGGYLLVTVGYSLFVTLLQWWLHYKAILTPFGSSNSQLFTGILLLTAGIYQWSKLKQVCLRFCRSPFHFLMVNWKEGVSGALYMGIKHGLLCAGCCWALMLLMFMGGVMNLLWMIVITAIILIEKVAPRGDIFAKTAGVAMMLVGFYFFINWF